MNIEYILYKDKDVIVEDENGNKRVIQYQDNIKELLTQENLVEELETELANLETSLIETERLKNVTKKAIPYPFYAMLLGYGGGAMLISQLISGEEAIVQTIFGPASIYTAVGVTSGTVVIPLFGLISILDYQNYKTYQKRENGLQAKLSALKQILSKEKEILTELKNDKTDRKNDFDQEFRCIRIEEPEKLYLLREDLRLYYDCGYNERKYLKFYDKGILSIKLQKSYLPHRIKLAEEYLEEKRKVKSLNERCN